MGNHQFLLRLNELLSRLAGRRRLDEAIAELARTARRPRAARTRALLPAGSRLVRAGLRAGGQ